MTTGIDTEAGIRNPIDDDGDGVVGRVEIYVRDANGVVIRAHFVLNGDGTANRVNACAGNESGRLLRAEVDDGADDAVDWSECHERDASGTIYRIGFNEGLGAGVSGVSRR